jgi:uncharacterized protein (TIGR00255 family)
MVPPGKGAGLVFDIIEVLRMRSNAMAVYSMTGFANATAVPGSTGLQASEEGASRSAGMAVELRSVNGRFLDLAFRLPDELRDLEPTLRELLGAAFRRGKIELRLVDRRDVESNLPQASPVQLGRLSHLESTVQAWLPAARALSVDEALHWCRGGGADPLLREVALSATRTAITGLREARAREGQRLVEVLMSRVEHLKQLAAQAEPLVPEIVRRQQQRFLERWREAVASAGSATGANVELPQDRALSEAAAFAIRIDVAEELARLRAHLDEIARLLSAGGEAGKRLDFLIQELHREANTLGSKSTALDLTGVAIEMKLAIEQMREQVQNIE